MEAVEPSIEPYIESVKVMFERLWARDEYAMYVIAYTDIPGVSAYWDGAQWVTTRPWDKIQPAVTFPGRIGSLVRMALCSTPDNLGDWHSHGIPEAMQDHDPDDDFSWAPDLTDAPAASNWKRLPWRW